MAQLLYIESSPRKERSSSIQIARAFIDAYLKSHSDDTVEELDLWSNELPPFDGETINAKYSILHGENMTEQQVSAWAPVERVIHHFKSADKYLLSLPMWNFGIPYKLKQYIDILVQPSYTFSYSPEDGYKGLVTGKPVSVIYARGGAYASGSGGEDFDLQKRYMEQVLGFIGFTNINTILVEPTVMTTPDEKSAMMEAKEREARTIAKNY